MSNEQFAASADSLEGFQTDAGVDGILGQSSDGDHSLEQVREILFGAESRRAELARRALAGDVAERFGKLEAEHGRRFEQLLSDLNERFAKTITLLEKESAERREAMRLQHEELVVQLEATAKTLTQAKTDREELANLLNDVADRLRAAGAA